MVYQRVPVSLWPARNLYHREFFFLSSRTHFLRLYSFLPFPVSCQAQAKPHCYSIRRMHLKPPRNVFGFYRDDPRRRQECGGRQFRFILVNVSGLIAWICSRNVSRQGDFKWLESFGI